MIYPSEIHSLSDFQRHTREHMDRLKATGRPAVLTVNGKAAVVVQDAEAYQKLLAEAEQARIMDAIREGLESVDRGEGKPLAEVVAQIRREVRERHGEP
jgi:prevent-host-death family protein